MEGGRNGSIKIGSCFFGVKGEIFTQAYLGRGDQSSQAVTPFEPYVSDGESRTQVTKGMQKRLWSEKRKVSFLKWLLILMNFLLLLTCF